LGDAPLARLASGLVRPDYGVPVGDGTHDLPGSLRLASALPFVGRAGELAKLRALMPLAEGEGRRVALLAGEPGSGKSRLVREFAVAAATDGALVLYGAADAVVRTAYGPFVEALDRLTQLVGTEELREALDRNGGELTRLLPDLTARVDGLATPLEADPDTERLRLHTAVADLLTGAGRGQPLLLVLEDVHWADASTLLLLRHLARGAGDARLLLLATFRDTEADVSPELAETLADLRRLEQVERLRLAGLSEAEIGEFAWRASGCDPAAELSGLAEAIRDLTGGNAFLVCELWRALIETGAVEASAETVRVTLPLDRLASPESVREVTGQRLSRLDPGSIELLELAATVGGEFELEAIRAAAGMGEPELLAALEQAVASGMIEELPSQGLSCRFTHELVRRAIYDGLSRARQAELHLRVGEALEATGADSGRALADLAHHFAAGAPLGGGERAIEHNLRAARVAAAALAFDEAAHGLRTAIDVGVDDPAARAEIFLELGAVSHRAGKAPEAIAAFVSAAGIARELDSGELLARAAIGYEDACWRPGLGIQDSVELLEEGIAALPEGNEELRVALLAGLARALDFQGKRERGAIVRGNAVALARQLGDRSGLAKVLVRSYWSRGTSPLEEILAMLAEARDLADELGDAELRTEAMAWRVPTFVALCDFDAARAELTALLGMAEQTAQPFMHHVAAHYSSAIAVCDGRLDEAEAMAKRSEEWGRLMTGRNASGTYGIQMFGIRREQGRLAELAPAVRLLAGGAGREGPWRPGLVAVLAELGMESEAKRELSQLVEEGIDGFRDSLWLATLAYLADASAALGDESMAALIYPELEPLTGATVMIGHLVACYGAADRYLGMLAATLGEPARAERHFELALELNRGMETPTWVAHTAFEYARFLLGQGRGERERAEALLGEASTLAEQIGMQGLLAKVRSLGVSPPGAELPGGLSPREAQILELVARGLSNREIGEALTISEHTAANHIRSILRKTDCANRTEAASYAHRHGLVSP
jgi:DNA-binding CsgD family transcriptional regulator/tetratricopeptide (TPR) repeat protein